MSKIKMLPLPKWCYSDKHLHVGSGAIRKEVRGYSSAVAKHNVAARDAEIKALRAKTAVTMGVGAGDGSLFVHGDHESIKAAQAIVLQRDALRAEVDQAQASARVWRRLAETTEARAERLAEALRRAEGLLRSAGIIAESDLERPHSIATEIKNALRDHDKEGKDG